ncbi:MAG: flagellar export chaperone FliS [Spirochaetales bacterium]|nr:flagellar export chaperone FliS [Spirochaetales bacterium]
MSTKNPLNAYRETRIKTASQGQLIIMLYDEAIKQLDTALDEFNRENRKLDLISNAIIKTQDLVTELMVSLDFEKGGDIAKNLLSLYMFFNRQLMEANMRKEGEPLTHVRKMLFELRGAWTEVIQKNRMDLDSPGAGVNIAG